MSTSAETGVERSDGRGRHAAMGQGSTPNPSDDQIEHPHDGGIPSAHTEPVIGVRPHDGGIPSAHDEPANTGVVRPHDGGIPSAHVEPAVLPHDGGIPSAHEEPAVRPHDGGIPSAHTEPVRPTE